MSNEGYAISNLNGRIVRSEDPPNLETPFSSLDGFITPTKSFYVRTHFPIPRLERATWRLKIEGEVNHPFEIGYDELVSLPARTFPVTLECAGNNRIFLEPKVKGVQWELGAVGTAEWTGVPLAAILERAEPKHGALEVILEGCDHGKVADAKGPAGEIRFARSLPLAKAFDDVLLAWQMNGEELRPEHGFPLRAIVPGWYAMASIKWLERIVVSAKPFQGYYQTLDYAYWNRRENLHELTPLAQMSLKAEISFPENGVTVPAGTNLIVRGAAWGGNVQKVEVSADAGKTWKQADFTDENRPNAWRRWQLKWMTPATEGPVTLMARAFDDQGQTQPVERDSGLGTYMIHHLLPISVQIRRSPGQT
jgi:DMSO/TMAO reductase YedYZ molybdopterin-dependent catalytic subunit